MKIAQLTSNMYEVNTNFTKAIGSHVAWLSNKLVERGHKVDLFAADNSETDAALHGISPALASLDLPEDIKRYYTMLNIARCYEFANKNCDIVHSHFNLLSSFISITADVPNLISVHSPIRDEIRPLLKEFKNENYVSFTLAQRAQMPELNWAANIYHGVDVNLFTYNPKPQDYLLYLGRITEDKGVHYAIESANALGMKLLIAGTSYPSEGYWHKFIEPNINGKDIHYMGEASLETKIELLQNAKALLFPTNYNEVFGYVMIEAMSCGTPVIGFDRGSVPEIIQDEQTGFVVKDVKDMIKAIKKIDSIDRKAVRKRAETYFSLEKMVTGYEKVYERIIKKANGKKRKK